MLETTTGNHMAIKELTKQDILVIESMTKSFSSEVWKLKKKYESDPSKNDLFAPLYNLKDLVSRSSRVGNSWPVLNAGSQLKGTNYYFEVQKGKTENYSGEVVVCSSFITRMR
mgnify:CR=1 FL=1